MGEGCSARDEAVQIWRGDAVVPKGVDGVEPLVVGEEEENMGHIFHKKNGIIAGGPAQQTA